MGKDLSEMTLEELWELFPIILQEHNPMYKFWYIEEKENIEKIVGINKIARINHIGSSAVEGLVSKPTVDILLEITCECNTNDLIEKLKSDGWYLMSLQSEPDLKIAFCKGYTPNGFSDKVFHLHVRYLGDWDELYFRDYLINHKNVAKEYGDLKQNLKEKYEHDRDGYTEAKSEFVKKWTKVAKKEFNNKYLP
jgi:GrpB-like predicted nucleotidyltransferase (UPF0157 family)